jgi:hypothetical protein
MDRKLSSKHHIHDEAYLAKIQGLISDASDMERPFERPDRPRDQNTKVFYTDMTSEFQISNPSDLITHSAAISEAEKYSICVIENISSEYVEALGSAWDIDPAFFVAHATNPNKEELWNTQRYVWEWSPPSDPEADCSTHYGHLDGIYEYHDLELAPGEAMNSSPNFIRRHCFKDSLYPIQSNTRISYYRVNHSLCQYIFQDL